VHPPVVEQSKFRVKQIDVPTLRIERPSPAIANIRGRLDFTPP